LKGYIDIERARHLMSELDLDALLLCTPEDFFYGTGYTSMIFELYRRAPMAMALLPLGKEMEPAAIVPDLDVDAAREGSGVEDVRGYPVWAERYDQEVLGKRTIERACQPKDGRGRPAQRLPEQYDRDGICHLLSAILVDRGLSNGTIGLELDFVDANTFSVLQRTNEDVTFVDSTSLMEQLRSVKSPGEIEWLRKACALTEAGIAGAASSVGEGATEASVRKALCDGVWRAATEMGLTKELDRVGGQIEVGGPRGSVQGAMVKGAGAVVKFDVQVRLTHYHSDVGRSFVYGSPLPLQQRIYHSIREAHARARDALQPGARICDVFEVALGAVRSAGFEFYRRGHFGHSVGLDPKIEEPPFVSATETRPLLPGMVLALETPFYVSDLGSFQLEDMCLLTEDGCRTLSQLPRGLEQLLLAPS
jgi:Xaa-Pro dipeptidase